MKLIDFPQRTTLIAEHQKEYVTMPAHIDFKSNEGIVTCCWELTFWERIKFLFSGKIWHQILTFHKPLQPQLLSLDCPIKSFVEEEGQSV